MNNDHLNTGKDGELLAEHLLRSKGYEIMERNYRSGRCEIDLIARMGNEIVVIEVKTRNTNFFGYPETWVDQGKVKRLAEAAEKWLMETQHQGTLRYDIMAITLIPGEKPDIVHFEDAFWPEW